MDQGVDLSSEGFSEDKYGISRPQSSGWDIGAHEYNTLTPPSDTLVPPANLTIVPDN